MSIKEESPTSISCTNSPGKSGKDCKIEDAGAKKLPRLKNTSSLDLPMRMENFKAWSSTAMKCTKQAIEEKLGTALPTRDPEMEEKIEEVRRIQVRYQEISNAVRKISAQLNSLSTLEQGLAGHLTHTAQYQPELHQDFAVNAEAQRVVSRSSAGYAAALELFCDGLDTFCKRTVPDVLETSRQLEHARLVFDAYRNTLENRQAKTAALQSTAPTAQGGDGGRCASTEEVTPDPPTPAPPPKQQQQQEELNATQLRQKFESSQAVFLKLKADTDVKMKLLHENRVRVLRKHLQVLQTATLSHYANGFRMLESSLSTLQVGRSSSRSSLPVAPDGDLSASAEAMPTPSSFLEAESPSDINASPGYLSAENGADADLEAHLKQQQDVFDK